MSGRRRGAVSEEHHGDGGLAAVEFALVLPVLVALLFGIVVTGLVFIGRMQVQAASREGARAGAIASGQACNAAREQLSNFSSSSVTCTELRDCATTGSRVQLQVTQNVSIPVLGNRTVSIDATSVYACQA
jgi:Flp pilus assembly protein TadG